MNILYVTTVGCTMNFFYEEFKHLIEQGHTIELACSSSMSYSEKITGLGLKHHEIGFSRFPLSRGNIKAYKQLKRVIENNNYDIVHCHTPNAAAVTRLVCKKFRKAGLKVIYTAHGFHFFKGAPLKNWLLYYPVEWLCAHWTDVLITINQEDYALAQKHMHAKRVEYVPGVGIDLEKFKNVDIDRKQKREEIGVPEDAILLLSVGELSHRKNHELVIKAIAQYQNKKIKYCVAGIGQLKEHLENLIQELQLTEQVKLLGYRQDISDLYGAADFAILPSFQEGLPIALMEAMASGLPCIASRIRGNVDLIDEQGGTLFDPHSVDECRKAIEKLLTSDKKKCGEYNRNKIKAQKISQASRGSIVKT